MELLAHSRFQQLTLDFTTFLKTLYVHRHNFLETFFSFS